MNDLRDNPKTPWGFGEVLKLSWPASLTMLSGTLIRFVDGLMVSYVGHAPLSAQMVAGMWSFVPESFVVGMLTVVNTYVSQNYGAGNYRQTARYVWAGMLLAAGFALLLAPLAVAARPIFDLFRPLDDPQAEEILGLQVMYFRYMILSVALTMGARPIEQFFFGVHRPRIVLVAAVAANVWNIAWDYVLIFGKLGLPALGLQGAAIASVTAWALQFLILFSVFLSPRIHEKFATRLPSTTRWRHSRQLLKLGWPAGLQLCNDLFCWSVFLSVLVGRCFGVAHLTASVVAMRYMGLSFMPAVGIGIATTALVGKHIGEGRPDLARRRTHTGLIAAVTYMGACGLAFWLLRYPMVSYFVHVLPSAGLSPAQALQEAETIIRIGTHIMICAAVFQLFDAFGIIYVGALRGAGDTLVPMVLTLLLSWGMVVGGGAIMIYGLPQLSSIGPWLTASGYVVVLGVLMAWRFEGGAWRKIDLLGRARPAPAPIPIVEHTPAASALTAPGTLREPQDVDNS